jgi:hypothetical protein
MKSSNTSSENKWMDKLSKAIQELISYDRFLGFARLIAPFIILFFFIQLGRLIFEDLDTSAVIAGWEDNNSLFQALPDGLQDLFATFFSGVFIRYLYFPLAGLIGAMLLLARYLQDTYKLPRFSFGFGYVFGSLFGVGYPGLRIKDGKKKVDPQEINLLDLKGGPGFVQVSAGSVALIEDFNEPVRVLSRGAHYVSQTELIKDVNNLEDHHGYIEQVPATTKDGIPILVRDIHFRFRVRSGLQTTSSIDRTPEQPYPYTEEAVEKIAYNRIVTSQGLSAWQLSVQLAVQSVITDYVAGHRIDDLTTAPTINDPNPRIKIRNRLYSESSKERLKNLGTELLWVDIGHFDILRKDERDPRPKKWGKKWEGVSNAERAFGEGERLYYQELGRAEAQAEMLTSILESLHNASTLPSTQHNLQRIFLVRTAQILEALTEKQSRPELPSRTRRALKRPRRRRRR